MKTEQRIKDVMASVIGVDPSAIDETASPETLEGWDSLNHMKLVVALEEEFGVTFKDEEVLEMQNYKLIAYTLSQYVL